MKIKNNFGFTITELLVVIFIITILATMVSVYSQHIRRAARDTKRQAELEQIRGALEMYRADNLQTGYPATDQFTTALAPAYISQMPTDVLFGTSYFYIRTSGTTYDLCAYLEAPKNPCTAAGTCCVESCGTQGTCNYRVTQP